MEPASAAWRFSLERIDNRRERRGFARLSDLVAFIQASLEEDEDLPKEKQP